MVEVVWFWSVCPFPPANGAGGSDCIRRPRPLKGVGAGASLDSRARPVLRRLAGLGATMTSTGGVVGFDFDLSLFVGLLSAGGTVVVPSAALDELDAAPGVREALLLLALAFAAGGGAEGSRLAARAFASALGTEAARFGSCFSGIGVVGEIFQLLGVSATLALPAANSSAKSSPEIFKAYLPHMS